jgi:predicted Rossmann fold nucleotide-binding protein DprA/Smf involved in DNA uptake
VFVVPGSVFSNLSLGKIQIANEFAKNVYSGCQINEMLNVKSGTVVDMSSKSENQPILKILNDSPMTVNEISEALKIEISDLSRQLTLLSVDEKVEERGGRFYAC